VLYPFLPARRLRSRHREELARIVATVPAFPFRLAEIDTFPGTAYLAPRPAEPFVALTEMVTGRWPAFPPYQGAFEAVIPHVTLGEEVTAEDLAPTVAPHLPIDAEATEVLLMERDRLGSWTTRWRFPLGEGPPQ
jgi:2'-5' RNA ligase